MAIEYYTHWEVRTTGSSTNGGGFIDLDPGTSVDYSQQDAAQLALTDLVSDVTGVIITSTTGGFTAAMVGNIIYIAGGDGFTAGWYQIVTYTDTNTIVIDRSATASKTGGTGNVGGAYDFDIANAALFTSAVNKGWYNYVWVKSGTYSVGGFTIAAFQPRWEGYLTTRGDQPAGTDRPVLSASTNVVLFFSADGGNVAHMRFHNSHGSASNNTMLLGFNVVLAACKVTRENYNTTVLKMRTRGALYGCEVSHVGATKGIGIELDDDSNVGGQCVQGCYVHDCTTGIIYTGLATQVRGCTISGNVVAECSASGVTGGYGWQIHGNTIYNCAYGIDTDSVASVMNNIIQGSSIAGMGPGVSYYARNNCFYDNLIDFTSNDEFIAASNLFENPLLTDPDNGDFSLADGSPCFSSGIGLAQTSLGA